jgi:hypothetical protein
MIQRDWQFVGLSPGRPERLTEFFEFEGLVQDIPREMRSVRFKKDKGTHVAKGSWRPIFWFDMFFSSSSVSSAESPT